MHERFIRDNIDYEEFHRQSCDNRQPIIDITRSYSPRRAYARERKRERERERESEYRGFDVISIGKQGQFHKSPSTDTIPFFKSRECAALKRIKADVVNSGATLRHIELHGAASRRIEIQAAVVVCAAWRDCRDNLLLRELFRSR